MNKKEEYIIMETFYSYDEVGPTDIPLAEGVDLAKIEERIGEKPFLVKLPIAPIKGTSRNGVPFDEVSADRLISEIMLHRAEGNFGHIAREQRGHRYDRPSIRWIGATKHTDNRVWALGYVPPSQKETQEYFLDAADTRSPVGLSVYGKPGKNGSKDMSLESIDIGHHLRLGFPEASGIPVIQNADEENEGDKDVKTAEELIAEMEQVKTQHRDEVKELKPKAEGLDLIMEFLDEDDPKKAAKTVIAELQQLRNQKTVTSLRKYLDDTVDDEANADIIAELFGLDELAEEEDPLDLDKLKAKLKKFLERETIQEILEDRTIAAGGPRAFARRGHEDEDDDIVPGRQSKRVGNRRVRPIKDSPEAREAARSQTGF